MVVSIIRDKTVVVQNGLKSKILIVEGIWGIGWM